MSTGENGQTGGAGRLVAGRYRVTAALGRGGMGVVWKAVDEVLGREVAVKELRTYTDAAGPELAALQLRMQREARAAARVRHPGVIAVHDIAQVDGRPLIVMELVDGPSLDDVLRERGTLDPDEAAGIGAKVMDALAAAHRAGVLHRDVKPGNILLDRSGRVVLTDFGIATMDDPGDGSATHLTRSGELVGSLDYLAPERAQGADPGPASDIWALGATLYAAVEGSSPFRRTSTFSTLTAIVSEPLPEPRRAGPLGPVLQRLLDKRPESRPEADQARALLQAVADTGRRDTPTSTLRGPAVTPPRAETERSVPAVPPGFGPPQQSQAEPDGGTGPDAQNPATTPRGTGPVDPGGTTPAASAPTTPLNPDRAASRRKGRALLAAAAVAVVLAAAGTTVALLDDSGGKDAGAPADATRAKGGAFEPGGADDGSRAPRATQQGDDDKDVDPSKKPADEKASEPTGRATGPAPEKPAGGGGGGKPDDGTSGGGSGGGATTGGGSATPATGCHSRGGGKYNCQVWKTADSYTASGTKIGILNAGTNYFYCQQNLGRRETSGEWTNVWWAKTDDDSGNTDVWVSGVYIKGGDNDAPVPGLPVC
ncbi:protein kinase [Streptomyces sp. NEAU-H22]|uniref:serine/threonine-protein kinase n=1 Tax=unclassified Streptomyces TaxID=2593676 RepID=UPI00225258B1|nr:MULTISPECIES: serine/threonine protein kinase [unclassified Streptomyces]MCX3290315.1 protein kinase [Streptomyces sp. NEAU-H22]WMD07067.1 protein kinase [Streptomyces sp. FXY-T5]